MVDWKRRSVAISGATKPGLSSVIVALPWSKSVAWTGLDGKEGRREGQRGEEGQGMGRVGYG